MPIRIIQYECVSSTIDTTNFDELMKNLQQNQFMPCIIIIEQNSPQNPPFIMMLLIIKQNTIIQIQLNSKQQAQTMADQLNPYLQYYSLLFGPELAPRQLPDLGNGLGIAQVLSKIKQFPSMKLEQNPKTFAHYFSNMKEIYKKIEEFWNQFLDKQLQCEQIDLVEIAHHKNVRQITKILDLLIQTLVLSSQSKYFVSKILETSSSTQQYFMSIVQCTLQKRKTFSPRKQRQQRLYDKMIEMEHQNENLQNVIVDLCIQREQADRNAKKLLQKLSQKQLEIKKQAQFIQQLTPKNAKQFEMSEQSNTEQLRKMRQKVLQMGKQHQKKIQSYKQQIQFYKQKLQVIPHYENQIELYKVKLQTNNQSIQQYAELSKKYAQIKLQLIEKEEVINEFNRKFNSKALKLQELEEKVLQLELEVERKNVQIQQLNQNVNNSKSNLSIDDQISSINSVSLHRTLSQHCPQVANSHAQFLYESNKKLREELERATSTIKDRQSELEKVKKQMEKRENYEIENKKLVEIIETMTNQHDQEKNLILGSMYELRMKTFNEFALREKTKKAEIKNNLKADSIRVISRCNVNSKRI